MEQAKNTMMNVQVEQYRHTMCGAKKSGSLNWVYQVFFWGITALITTSEFAQSYIIYTGDPPEGGTLLARHSVVLFNGKISLTGLDFYDRTREAFPDKVSRIPTDFSQVSLTLDSTYIASSGDQKASSMVVPLGGLYNDTLAKGYYRNMQWTYSWPAANGESSLPPVISSGKIVVPDVHKIPVYVYTGALNEPLFSVENKDLDMIRLRTLFLGLEHTVSSLATNIDDEYRNNFGCSGWYQFRFSGFVNGLDDGITKDGQLSQLMPGITLVPYITYCGGPAPDGVQGCATLGGTKIAIPLDVFISSKYNKEIITLHEIGHTKGLDHDTSGEGNLMTRQTNQQTVAIRNDQCPAFSVGKNYVTPEPWND